MDSIAFETEIVWLEDCSNKPYVREILLWCRGRTQEPEYGDRKILGYARVSDEYPLFEGSGERRAFYLKDHDPYGYDPIQMPAEAVDPSSVAPGIRGARPKPRQRPDTDQG